MTKEKLKDLRERMVRHTEVNDIAVVVLTARELQEMLDEIERLQSTMDWVDVDEGAPWV